MFCEKCGNRLDDDAIICSECGTCVYSMEDDKNYDDFKKKLIWCNWVLMNSYLNNDGSKPKK